MRGDNRRMAELMLRTDQPLFVFGGCYSNLQATRAVLAIAGQLGFDASHIICTGARFRPSPTILIH